jgi:SAM-dependent methyltransferase
MMRTSKKMEIGPGRNRIGADWVGFGPRPSPTVDVVGIWGEESLPFADDSFSLIYASHVIEHIWWYNTHFALSEAYRCLMPKGILELWTVDFDRVIEAYISNVCGDRYRKYNPDNDPMVWLNGKLFAYGTPPEMAHHACFSWGYLEQCLLKAGFSDVYALDKPRGTDHESNLGMGAVK